METKAADTASVFVPGVVFVVHSPRSGKTLTAPGFKLQWFSFHTGVSSLTGTVPAYFREGVRGRKHSALEGQLQECARLHP